MSDSMSPGTPVFVYNCKKSKHLNFKSARIVRVTSASSADASRTNSGSPAFPSSASRNISFVANVLLDKSKNYTAVYSFRRKHLLDYGVPVDREKIRLLLHTSKAFYLYSWADYFHSKFSFVSCESGLDNPIVLKICSFLCGRNEGIRARGIYRLCHFAGYSGQLRDANWAFRLTFPEIDCNSDRPETPIDDENIGGASKVATVRLPQSLPVFRPIGLSPAPIKRIDCAACKIEASQVLFCGGCGTHPSRCQPDDFYESAVIYDALLNEWKSAGVMSMKRHGAACARIRNNVFVFGGSYPNRVDVISGLVRPPDQDALVCDVYDIDTKNWARKIIRGEGVERVEEAAFFPAAGLGGRVVFHVPWSGGNQTFIYSPRLDRFARAKATAATSIPQDEVPAGGVSCCVCKGRLFVMSGRLAAEARRSYVFEFATGDFPNSFFEGNWTRLSDFTESGRTGAASCSVHGDRAILASGGFDEATRTFSSRAEVRWMDGEDAWTSVPSVRMPVGLHAHTAFELALADEVI